MPRLSGQDSESSRNRNRVLSLCSLGTGIGIEFKACAVSEPDSESCSSHGQSRNRNRNRVPRLDSLRTGIGIEKTGTGNLCSDWSVCCIRRSGYFSLATKYLCFYTNDFLKLLTFLWSSIKEKQIFLSSFWENDGVEESESLWKASLCCDGVWGHVFSKLLMAAILEFSFQQQVRHCNSCCPLVTKCIQSQFHFWGTRVSQDPLQVSKWYPFFGLMPRLWIHKSWGWRLIISFKLGFSSSSIASYMVCFI